MSETTEAKKPTIMDDAREAGRLMLEAAKKGDHAAVVSYNLTIERLMKLAEEDRRVSDREVLIPALRAAASAFKIAFDRIDRLDGKGPISMKLWDHFGGLMRAARLVDMDVA